MMRRDVKDTDFMSELEAATQMRPATSATLMLFTIIALVLFAIGWAAISKVEELTRGQGQVVPSKDIQVIQSLEGGILQELMVQEGQSVKAGEPLLRISDVQFSSEERGTEARSVALRAKKARLEAEAGGQDFMLPEDITKDYPQIAQNEQALYNSRQKELENVNAILDDRIRKASADLSEIKAQINRLYQSRKLLNDELEITKEMVRKRAVPKLEEMRLSREIADLGGQINALAQSRRSLEAELDVARKEKSSQDDKFRSQALGELNEVETQISGLKESLKSIGDRVERAEIRSPVDGIVNSITIKTIGGVIEPAMPVIEVVPLDDELKVIAKINPSDIGFIREGLPAKVKITAYDPQKYGALEGTLVRRASNSVTDRDGNIYFEVEVRTEQNYMGSADNPLPITPGMIADVEIITGKRTILDYLLKPVLRAKDRAFTER